MAKRRGWEEKAAEIRFLFHRKVANLWKILIFIYIASCSMVGNMIVSSRNYSPFPFCRISWFHKLFCVFSIAAKKNLFLVLSQIVSLQVTIWHLYLYNNCLEHFCYLKIYLIELNTHREQNTVLAVKKKSIVFLTLYILIFLCMV